jgi:hypothetical protein
VWRPQPLELPALALVGAVIRDGPGQGGKAPLLALARAAFGAGSRFGVARLCHTGRAAPRRQ